jgi:thiol-disulfide isomerase/thioredoxin
MRRLWVGILGVALLVPVLRADAQTKPPKEQYEELEKGFQKEMGELQQKFRDAKTQAEKAKVRDQAFTVVAPGYARKMLALAKAHPKEAFAEDALVFVCTVPGSLPEVPEAVNLLLRDHAGSNKLADTLQGLAGREDAEALLRSVRTKATKKPVQLLAGYFLAEALREKDEPTAAQTQEAEKLLAEFVEKAADVPGLGPQMIEMAKANLNELRKFAVGKTAPAAESKDLDGKAVKLSDHKGKVVVLDFWATWCGPCRDMIPHERAMVRKYAGKPFVLVSVSADDKKETLKEFLDKEPMPWVHWWDGAEAGVIRDWNIQGFPTFYVIDARGVIRGKIVGGGPDKEKKLDTLVEKLVQEAAGPR